jgi:hypothetical protein
MYTSFGIIRVRPQTKSTPLRPWWSIVQCCPGLTDYYLKTSRRPYWFHKGLQRPAWGGHITIIRGEEPHVGKRLWEALEGVELTFQYDGSVETDGKHLWLPVFCEAAEDVRLSLGLPRQPEFPFHLTFAVAEG